LLFAGSRGSLGRHGFHRQRKIWGG
jgi:hypothetical protein